MKINFIIKFYYKINNYKLMILGILHIAFYQFYDYNNYSKQKLFIHALQRSEYTNELNS